MRALRTDFVLVLALALFAPVTATVAHAGTDFRDIAYLQQLLGEVLENENTGAEIEWFNEATGNSGMVRILRTYFPSRRRARSRGTRDGAEQTREGACRTHT